MNKVILALGVAFVATSAFAGGDLKVDNHGYNYHDVYCRKTDQYGNVQAKHLFKVNSKGESFLLTRIKKQASFKEFFKTGKSEFWKNPTAGWMNKDGTCGMINPWNGKVIHGTLQATDGGHHVEWSDAAGKARMQIHQAFAGSVDWKYMD